MFDNLNNKNQPNTKSEDGAEDIFSKMDAPRREQAAPIAFSVKQEKPDGRGEEAFPRFHQRGGVEAGQTQAMDIPSAPRPFPGKQSRGNAIKWVLVTLVIVVIIALVGFVGWKLYSRYVQQPLQSIEEKNMESSRGAGEEQPAGGEVGSQENALETSPQKELDRDGDGLTDEAELRLKTNPMDVDSDNDGLFDNEEIVIYKSDPLNRDSDGDTFADGEEVTNGYDPNGPGKLFELP